ncbi:MAG TPA: alpha/beta hydrolase [Alphaproteobacteria bacterium]|nr:alpha/beta hydrolase [Alphaproteobacteria bacterium]
MTKRYTESERGIGVKIYRDYDQAELDAQYNLRARFPSHTKYMAQWQADGDAELARPGWHRDLAYGPTAAEKLDLIVPPAGGNRRAPLMVFIHGGYWQNLDKRDCAALAPAFVKAGIAYATINYTLAPVAGLDEIVRQARACLSWLWRNAPLLGCDPDRLFVAGHSAGGHITMMLAATEWNRLGGLPHDLLKGAFSISGIYDLEPIRLSYQNPVLKLDEGTVRRNSPIGLKPVTKRILLTVGEKEPEEFHRQQKEFAAAWRKSGAAVDVVPAPGLDHFDILDKFGNPEHAIGRAAIELVRS